jgi:GNAT superfamily N-acetyltransferase
MTYRQVPQLDHRSRPVAFTAKQLSPETWLDYEALFGKYDGVRGGCWCTFFHLFSKEFDGSTRAQRKDLKRRLVLQARAHGILVYDGDTPVAWCQFGPPEELPRPDRGRAYSKLGLTTGGKPLWRITCFFVDREYRRRGLTGLALREALAAIRRRGGGVVEAFPFVIPGRPRPSFSGSLTTFEKAGFKVVSKAGKNEIVVRKTVRAARLH